jgi:hypothetical protein
MSYGTYCVVEIRTFHMKEGEGGGGADKESVETNTEWNSIKVMCSQWLLLRFCGGVRLAEETSEEMCE